MSGPAEGSGSSARMARAAAEILRPAGVAKGLAGFGEGEGLGDQGGLLQGFAERLAGVGRLLGEPADPLGGVLVGGGAGD